MNVFESVGLRILIVRPGSTELDEQGRIAGSLDIPLSENGIQQVNLLAAELQALEIGKIYAGPSAAAKQTAELLSGNGKIKIKLDDDLKNFDYGLWHGKRIEELKEKQPKLFKLWQDQPQSVCPPNGETVEQLISRVQKVVKRITKKQRAGTIVIVTAEPVACILRSILEGVEITEYWTTASNCGTWDSIVTDSALVSD